MKIDCTIKIIGNRAYIAGNFPLDELREATSYFIKGAQYSQLYNKHIWSGRKNLYSLSTKSMHAGLTQSVIKLFKELDPKASIELLDDRELNVPAAAPDRF